MITEETQITGAREVGGSGDVEASEAGVDSGVEEGGEEAVDTEAGTGGKILGEEETSAVVGAEVSIVPY